MQSVKKQETLDYTENLIDLVVEFIQFVDGLFDEGRITKKQYEDLIKHKVDFLKRCNF